MSRFDFQVIADIFFQTLLQPAASPPPFHVQCQLEIPPFINHPICKISPSHSPLFQNNLSTSSRVSSTRVLMLIQSMVLYREDSFRSFLRGLAAVLSSVIFCFNATSVESSGLSSIPHVILYWPIDQTLYSSFCCWGIFWKMVHWLIVCYIRFVNMKWRLLSLSQMVWFVKPADVIRWLYAVNEADAAGPSHTSVIQSITWIRDEDLLPAWSTRLQEWIHWFWMNCPGIAVHSVCLKRLLIFLPCT